MNNYYNDRNNKIVELADNGMSTAKIASKYMLTEQTIRKILLTHVPAKPQQHPASVNGKLAVIADAAAKAQKSSDKIAIAKMIARLANEIVKEMEP